MNIRKHTGSVFALILLVVFGCLSIISSCKKNGATVAVITVLDTIGRPVSGANVILWQDTAHSTQTGTQATLRQNKTSDVNGKASFEFQLEAYLNILAIKNGDSATGIVQLKEHETVDETVKFTK